MNTTGEPEPQGTWSDGELLALMYGGDAGALGNSTLYQRAATMTWPWMVVWGPRSSNSKPTSALTCVRATNVTEGSQSLEVEGGNDNGGSHHKPSFVALAMIVITIGMSFAS